MLRIDWRMTMAGAASVALLGAVPVTAAPGDKGRDKVAAAIRADHDAAIQRLRQWIALPTIANMGINHKEGAEYMRQLALDAGFQQAKVIPTDGVPGVFATLDAGAKNTLAKDEAVAKLKAHLAKRGFGDIEVNVSGGYGPTQTDENSTLIKAARATLAAARIPQTMSARSAGSWPGIVFTGPPLNMAAGQFGAGRGGGAHAPDEWLLIESSNPKVIGFDDQAILFADFLYEVARAPRPKR